MSLHNQLWDEKAKNLYKGKHLLVIRFSTSGNSTFISANVKAEMKPTIYHINVCINSGGSILEAECDCAVGQGCSLQAHTRGPVCTDMPQGRNHHKRYMHSGATKIPPDEEVQGISNQDRESGPPDIWEDPDIAHI
jgi:hypothetical protein